LSCWPRPHAGDVFLIFATLECPMTTLSTKISEACHAPCCFSGGSFCDTHLTTVAPRRCWVKNPALIQGEHALSTFFLSLGLKAHMRFEPSATRRARAALVLTETFAIYAALSPLNLHVEATGSIDGRSRLQAAIGAFRVKRVVLRQLKSAKSLKTSSA
jgi:hypothetical protein